MSEESVGRIHKRFYLTLINPESHITSLLISFLCASLIVILSHVYYLNTQILDLASILPLSLGALYLGKIIDFAVLKKLPMTRMKKIYHTDAFANMLWLITVVMGIVASFVFSKTILYTDYIVAGMFLAMGFRIGIFTSVFGASLPRAMMLSPILPLIFFSAFVPFGSVPYYLSDPIGLGFGFTFIAIASIWSVIADRAGKPDIESTFKILQAYLLAWTDKNPRSMEVIMESRAQESTVSTYVISFKTSNGKSALVVPDVHPGPFHPVGGSNLPYEIYKAYSTNAMEAVVMHSISDHSLNLPSKTQVERYLKSLINGSALDSGNTCTEPLVIQVNKARVSGIAFGRVSVLLLSLSPHGMEDVPELIRKEVERYAEQKGFDLALVIDSHNSIGKHLSEDDSADMLKACRVALDELKMKPQYNFEFGLCHSSEIGAGADDVGPAGMSVMAIKANQKLFVIGWADGNNMTRNLRESIVEHLSSNGIAMLEICTSDTHYTSGKARNLTGYYTFGSLSPSELVGKWYLQMARKALERMNVANYEVSHMSSDVKVMGSSQFSDYSGALDRSMNITKVCLGVTVAVYVALLVLG